MPRFVNNGGKNMHYDVSYKGKPDRPASLLLVLEAGLNMDWIGLLVFAFLCGWLIGELVRQWRKK